VSFLLDWQSWPWYAGVVVLAAMTLTSRFAVTHPTIGCWIEERPILSAAACRQLRGVYVASVSAILMRRGGRLNWLRSSERGGKHQLLNVRSFDIERRLWRSSEGRFGS
jgi:hypothetical protein